LGIVGVERLSLAGALLKRIYGYAKPLAATYRGSPQKAFDTGFLFRQG
jgi:hypothetical protein